MVMGVLRGSPAWMPCPVASEGDVCAIGTPYYAPMPLISARGRALPSPVGPWSSRISRDNDRAAMVWRGLGRRRFAGAAAEALPEGGASTDPRPARCARSREPPAPPPSLLLRRWPPSLQTLRVSALPSAASTSCESDTAIQGSPQAHCGPTPEHDRIPGSGLGPSEPALPQCRLLSSPSTTTVSVRTGKPDDFLFRVYGIVG